MVYRKGKWVLGFNFTMKITSNVTSEDKDFSGFLAEVYYEPQDKTW